MKLDQIKLRHVANHKETVFDFPDAPIVALVGDSGSGKTSLIEAIPLAIYGISPSRNSNVYQAATRDWQGECEIEIVLSDDGERFRILRSWEQGVGINGSKHKVEIFEDLGKGWNQISSGKVSDAKKIIDELFPPYEIFLTTNFASQTGESLLSVSQENRREILGSLLSPLLFSELDSLYDKVGDERRLEEKRNTNIKQRFDFTKEQLQKLSEKATKTLAILRQECQVGEELLQRLEAELDEIVHHGNKLKERIQRVEYQAENLQQIEKDLEVEQTRLTEVEKEIADYVEEEFDESQFELLAKERKAESKLKDQLEPLQNKRIVLEREVSRLEAGTTSIFTHIQNIKKTTSSLEGAPCDDDLQQRCPFVMDLAKEKEKLPELTRELDEKKIQIAQTHGEIEEMAKEVADVLEKLSRFADLNKAERELLKLQQQIAISKTSHESLLREKQQLLDRIQKMKEGIDGIIIDPEARQLPGQVAKLRLRWTLQKEVIEKQRKDLTAIRRLLTLTESREEEKEKIVTEIEAIRKSVLISDAEMEIWKILEEGFSRKGAQSLLLKMELDLFEKIIQEYLEIVFENTGKDIRLFFETERLLKTKDEIRESLGIKIELNGIELNSEELSGGEAQGVSVALRAGLLSYHALKNPEHLSFLIVDEPTSAVDSKISVNVLGVFRKLSEIFPQILVSSYDEDLMRTAEVFKVQEVDGVAKIRRAS